MLVARCAAALGLLVVLGGGGCGQTSTNGPGTTVAGPGVDAGDDASSFDDVNTACLAFCPPTEPATLNLSCPSLVTSVASTGGCTASRCQAKDGGSCAQAQVSIEPTQAGVCHVDLTLASGFQYSTDLTFVKTTSESICPCTSIGPTESTFIVDNPSTTCVDAGASDAGASDADADSPMDAPSETAVDAVADAGTDASTDGPSSDATCPPDIPCGCACPSGNDGGVCVCQNFSMPACPASFLSGPCGDSENCMGCQENAGFTCICSDDAGASGSDGGGPQWQCIATGYACTGGTP
jgi:hypothetical protein